MAKYVIDIPEETKQAFDNADDINFSFYDYNSVIGKAIRNATPLPKTNREVIETLFGAMSAETLIEGVVNKHWLNEDFEIGN